MRVCPTCKYSNFEGVLFCEDCGSPLAGVPSTTTQALDITEASEGKQTWGTARFTETSAIVIHFRDSEAAPVMLKPQDETTMGRYDGTSPNVPTLDLTPFGAYEKGVSRMHAAIRRGEGSLNLVDLGSVNGTFLNGQRLIPNRPHIIRDGDEIKFGKLMCHVYFKALPKTSLPTPPQPSTPQ
jgi:hypothetical protein